eukprot:15474823-Alexandrium_andersonii.AAC.1
MPSFAGRPARPLSAPVLLQRPSPSPRGPPKGCAELRHSRTCHPSSRPAQPQPTCSAWCPGTS